MKCPAGHELPHETPNGQCTPIYCSTDGALVDGTLPTGKKSRKQIYKDAARPGKVEDIAALGRQEKAEARAAVTATTLATKKEIEDSLVGDEHGQRDAQLAAIEAERAQISRVGTGLGALAIRQAFLKIPKMSGEDAETWAQNKAVELLPTALGEVEFRLKFGTDDQRYEAAKDVLDMNGMRKRDALASGGNTIILNIGSNGTPWAKKVVQTNVVDALPADTKAGEK